MSNTEKIATASFYYYCTLLYKNYFKW